MEERKDQEVTSKQIESEEEEFELNHADKLVGVFTEPGNVFSSMSKFPPKVLDWLLPVILVIVLAALSNIVMMNNPTIKYDIIEKRMAQMEENLNKDVEAGTMTQEAADQRIEMTREFMEKNSTAGLVFQVVGIVVVVFILFFVISGVWFLGVKFGLKGDGSYKSAMAAYGLPYYIAALQIIVMVILAFAMGKFMAGTSVADIMGMEKDEFLGFLLSKADIFSIWFYAVLSIGLAKMFKSEETGKYFAVVFGLWLGFSILFFFLAQKITFLKSFMM
ncbi:MAG: YIP1 family protein [Bacteroidetes bacterium]|nr:YIP1 family protein [Bacteroidota bacterium]MBU1680693.1 YIP1 family protein [Bacteroidota bacterium]MBU2505202.1 YIP1 family protein [Bacteroidota bacterium]